MKRNKIRYQSTPKPRVAITLTGNVYLNMRDEEGLEAPAKGDLKVYPRCESVQMLQVEDYDSTGFSGYFKVDVFDGKGWRLVLLQEIFPHKENHFSKTECPIDTFGICEEILTKMAGQCLVRTYREHYEPESTEAEAD